MAYVRDRLYRDVISKKMAHLASCVKVREIVPLLPCLTLTDQEEIEAKRETAGNYSAMVLLLDNLRRRENWPEEFIEALRACEHRTLADEISTAYDQIRGINNQAAAAGAPPAAPPASPLTTVPTTGPAPSTTAAAPFPVTASTTVTTATVHSVPHSASPLLTPEGPPAQAAIIQSVPNMPPAAQDKAPETPTPLPPELTNSADPLLPISAPKERRPSPVLPSEEIFSLEQSEVSVSPGAAPALSALSAPPLDAAPCLPIKLVTTPSSLSNKPSITLKPSAVPEKEQEPAATTGKPSSLKHPIQDSHPPGKELVLTENSKNGSTINQLVDRKQTTVPHDYQAPAASLGTAQVSTSVSDDAIDGQLDQTAEYLSKPGVLSSEVPLSVSSDDLEISYATIGTEGTPMQPAPVSSFPPAQELLQEPCSITSADLMISSVATETINSSPVQNAENLPQDSSFSDVVSAIPTESVLVSNPGASGRSISDSIHEVSTHLENDFLIAPFSNQPVEDHYESQPGTMVNTIHFSENPSIQNLDGCSQRMQGNVVYTHDKPVNPNHNTHTDRTISTVIFEHQSTLNNQGSSGQNASAMINTPQSERGEEAKVGLLAQLQSNPLLIGAIAVGVTALFFAWRLKYKS